MRSDPSGLPQAWGPGAQPSPLLLIFTAAIPARGRGHRRSLAAGVVLVPARLLVLKAPPIGRVIMKLLGLHRSAVQTTLIAVLGLVAVTQNHVLFQDAFGQLGQRACSITLALRGQGCSTLCLSGAAWAAPWRTSFPFPSG